MLCCQYVLCNPNPWCQTCSSSLWNLSKRQEKQIYYIKYTIHYNHTILSMFIWLSWDRKAQVWLIIHNFYIMATGSTLSHFYAAWILWAKVTHYTVKHHKTPIWHQCPQYNTMALLGHCLGCDSSYVGQVNKYGYVVLPHPIFDIFYQILLGPSCNHPLCKLE